MPINPDDEDLLLSGGGTQAPSAPSVATSYTMGGSASSMLTAAVLTVTITPVGGPLTGSVTVTPSGSAATGLTAQVLTFAASSSPQTATFTPAVAGTLTIAATNSASLADPAALTITVVATGSGGSSAVLDWLATMIEPDPLNAGSYRLTAASLMNLGGGFLVTASSADSVSFVGPGDVADHAYERKMLYPAQTEESGLIASHTKQGSGPTAVHTVALDPDADSTLSVAPPVGSFVNISVDRAS